MLWIDDWSELEIVDEICKAEDAEFCFWKDGCLKFDDTNDNFEEEEGIEVSAIDILIEEEDIVDIL